MKFTPHNYQKDIIKFMVSQGAAGILVDPGLGKTSSTYAAFHLLKKQGLVERMLVIAPLRVAHSVWPAEAQKWDDFNHLRVHVLHGSQKKQLLNAPHDVSVVNPEGLEWLASQLHKQFPWDMLVVDESTRFKHTDTLRFKTLRPMLPRFRRRYILTGSPAPNGLMDLFGQVYILDQGAALGRYITHFRNTYFDRTGFGGFDWKLRAGADKTIHDKLKPLVLRMSAADHLDLPPLVNNTVRVDLPPKGRKAYNQMEDLLVAELDKGVVTAINASAATLKCRQIANGGVWVDGEDAPAAKRTWREVHAAKTEAVEDLVEELGGKPAFIAYEFKHDLERLQKAFPKAPYLGSGVSPKEAAKVEAAWNAGEVPVLLAQPQSVAHGLNLQGTGAAVIWHSLTWDLEAYEQFIRRVWRQGQKHSVVVHHVVAKDTVDEAIMKAIASKDRTQRALLDALKTQLRVRRR